MVLGGASSERVEAAVREFEAAGFTVRRGAGLEPDGAEGDVAFALQGGAAEALRDADYVYVVPALALFGCAKLLVAYLVKTDCPGSIWNTRAPCSLSAPIFWARGIRRFRRMRRTG